MKIYLGMFFICCFSSCIIHAPRYTNVENVLRLEIGMTKDSVTSLLGIPPYDLKSASDSEIVWIYKYRTSDRKTVPLLMNKTNGIKATGKWVDLFVTYKHGKVSHIESCSGCEETKVSEKKFDLGPIVALITALTLPAVLLYLGLKPN